MRTRQRRGLLGAALALIIVGALGATVTDAVMAGHEGRALSVSRSHRAGPGRNRGAVEGFASNGERIYFTGVGHAGRILIDWDQAQAFGGMMRGGPGRGRARFGCAMCHGADGKGRTIGRMMGIESADIRYSALTSPRTDEASGQLGWTDADIARAIREGKEPNGDALDPSMPRWHMDDTDMQDTVGYLKELDRR